VPSLARAFALTALVTEKTCFFGLAIVLNAPVKGCSLKKRNGFQRTTWGAFLCGGDWLILRVAASLGMLCKVSNP